MTKLDGPEFSLSSYHGRSTEERNGRRKRRGGVEGMFGKSVKQKGGPEAGICVAVQRVCTVHVVRIHICAMCF